jgi:Fungal specific transcription factor domain
MQGQAPKEGNGWLALLLESPPSTRALETSITAVCIASVGRQHDDPGLVKDSLKYYGQGLRELQKALWDPRLMYKDETLAACMALFMYEFIECPAESREGLISHMDGCARLIQLRGAEAHRSVLGHQLFLAFRLDGVRFLISFFDLLCINVYHVEVYNNIH